MAAEAVGWDWIGVNLDDGGAVMAFRMRDRNDGAVWAGGGRRSGAGATEYSHPEAVRFSPRRTWTSPRTSITYPVEFDVRAGGNRLRGLAADGRSGAGLARIDGHCVLGRRGARDASRPRRGARLPGADRLRRPLRI